MKIPLPGIDFNAHVILFVYICEVNKGVFSGLWKFLATENPLRMMKNAFYFTLKSLFVLKTFKFLFWFFDLSHVEHRLDLRDEVNFKIYDVTMWETSNCNTHIVQHLKKVRQSNN